VGHLLQGRYKAILIERESYLLELSRYIHLNPVRAGVVERPEAYPYSSYGAYAEGKEDEVLSKELILEMVGWEGGQSYNFLSRKKSPRPGSRLLTCQVRVMNSPTLKQCSASHSPVTNPLPDRYRYPV
jgi:hypothetical protein